MRKILNSFILFCFASIFIHTQSIDETIAILSNSIERADSSVSKIKLLQERAALYEISGYLDLALKDYFSLLSLDSSLPDLSLHILQLKLEMGEDNILSDISNGLLHSSPEEKSSWVVLQLRYLIQKGQWEEAENLVDYYKIPGEDNPSFIYLAWYIYSSGSKFGQSRYWAQLLKDHYPHSSETMLLLGLAEDIPSPEKLLWTRDRLRLDSPVIYYYQVGAYTRREGAYELVQKLTDIELESKIIEQGPWFKVLVPSAVAQNDSLENKLIQLGIQPFRIDL